MHKFVIQISKQIEVCHSDPDKKAGSLKCKFYGKCRKDYTVHSTIYFHVFISVLISTMYHSLQVWYDYSIHIPFFKENYSRVQNNTVKSIYTSPVSSPLYDGIQI